MKFLGIDIETYSSHDLSRCGVYKYTEADDFTILLFSYSVDGGRVMCCDFARGEELPPEIIKALRDPAVIKTAFNAMFERVCISRFFNWALMDPAQWRCTMVAAARVGLPLSLGKCAEVLQLEQGKMSEGRQLIRYFAKPTNGKRHMPDDDPQRWEAFKRYNIRDVEVEQAILKHTSRLQPVEFDEKLYQADQRINDRGVMADRQMVTNAAAMDNAYRERLLEEARTLTGIDNPNSPKQIKEYIYNVAGLEVESLNKKHLPELFEKLHGYPKAQRLLELRTALGKTSNKKYDTMTRCMCKDGRIRGLLQFYGASRTGRWAGRLVQVQNLPRNDIEDIELARQLVKMGSIEDLRMNYANPMQILSELIRTAFIAAPGHVFHVCDFNAIEARVIAWLAGERWVLDVFRAGGDIYCATAEQMFKVPVEKNGKNGHLRRQGKIAVLALGYGGGTGALGAMGAGKMGMTDEEQQELVQKWRKANAGIVRFWDVVERATIKAIKTGDTSTINRNIKIGYRNGALLVRLPSGRVLCYRDATIQQEKRRGWHGTFDVITYKEVGQGGKWTTARTYGGKLAENITQAVARDILGVIILRAEKNGLDIVFHIHDEVVVEAPEGRTLAEVEKLFSQPIEWCEDLPLKGSGYTTPYYLKK